MKKLSCWLLVVGCWLSANADQRFDTIKRTQMVPTTQDVAAVAAYTNRAATALQAEADTNALYRLSLETNRALAVEAALAAYTNRAATALQVEADTNALYRLSLETNRALAVEAALAAYTNRAATALQVELDSSALSAVSIVSQRVERVVAGTDAFEGILLDSEIHSWSDIGLTYTNAVRMNSEVIITNNATWTGWTTTGDLLTNGAIFLTAGQYLQSPVQSNGVSSYSFNEFSDMNGTTVYALLFDGTNLVYYPYTGTNAVLKITAGNSLPNATPGVAISNVVIIGYGDTVEARSGKMVSGLKIIDPPSADNDVVNKKYSDDGDAGVTGFAVAQIEGYAADDTKTLRGAQMRLNRSWVAQTANGQDWILSCGEIAGNGQLAGTSNYFAIAQNDYPLLTFSSEATGLYINSYTLAYPDATNRTVTLNIATNGVTGQPYAEWTKNLLVGEWTRVVTYSTNTYPTASGSNYVLRFTAPTGANGYFRAMQPSGQSRITISANILDLGSNVIQNVASISFTNGWEIICSTNGLQFVAP